MGEFIAAAQMLQVPHPPGSPTFLLVTRIAMMFPFADDPAVRAHAFNAVCSAGAIMFLFLVITRVVINFRGMPQNLADKLAVYGGGIIGALSLAFGTTYWSNSVEAEVYGVSMLLLSAMMWLVLRWRERAENEGSEKYLLLIAYLIGLSLGVHLLVLLVIFPVLMIIYFHRYEFSANSFIKFGIVAVLVFGVVYPGIVKWMPGMMDGKLWGTESDTVKYIPWVLIFGAVYGVYKSYKKKQKLAHVALLSIVLIFLGYTTYTTVLIRSNANPPMNENEPRDLARLTAYLGREQYGQTPLLDRRWSQEPHQQGIYTNYTSDMDFLIRYQLNHMFFRYLGWNYIGAEGDHQGAGVEWEDTFGIPFLMALLGLYYQFKKDWKMGLVFLTMFIVFGPLLALYQNQQEPQPRERHYFYVGAFYVFSVWIAIGIVAVLDYLRKAIHSPRAVTAYSIAVVGVFSFAIPVRLVSVNWYEHDRSGNYVAWDYSYNILQTCAKDAILFTNGDNDTFPLWYLQDVEGIRRDVRIVNLSLVNTPWYIKQAKNKPYYPEAKAVPMSLSDARIDRISPIAWETRTEVLPVPKEVFERFGVTDTATVNKGRIEWEFRNTLEVGQVKAIRIQDQMVHNIISANKWERPIYFAVTCAPNSKIGLDEYLWFHGLAWRLEPRKITGQDRGLDHEVLEANLFQEPEGYSKTPQFGYKFRNVANPDAFLEESSAKLMVNYRSAFIRLALYDANIAKNEERSVAVLDRMEEIIPRSKIPMGWELSSDIASFYHRLGRHDKFNEIADEIEPVCKELIANNQVNLNSYYNPYRILLEIYENRKDYVKKLEVLNQLAALYPGDRGLQKRISDAESQLKQQESGNPE
ncbi:MAG: DUF2723 domain-containing protein [Ignavibacteria bacterium]|nr:DUF2723 domain-containing protein [Ignavibacteria bacterium]